VCVELEHWGKLEVRKVIAISDSVEGGERAGKPSFQLCQAANKGRGRSTDR
jgi:hypothetical protein